MYINVENVNRCCSSSAEVTAADSHCLEPAETKGGGRGGGHERKEKRGMICGHWAKESHKGIHLCQDEREESGRRKD